MFLIRTGNGSFFYMTADDIESCRYTLERLGGYTIVAYKPYRG